MSNDNLKKRRSHQQQQISALLRTTGSEKIIESLARGIQEFDSDADDPIFFNDYWYAGYEDVFKKKRGWMAPRHG